MSEGREKGHLVSEETREKISNSINRIYQQDPKYRERVSNGVKEIWADPNSIYNSEEYRQKLSDAWKGENNPNYGKKFPKELYPNYGSRGKKLPPLSEETRRKLSIIRKGRKLSQETKDKISKANKGKIGNNLGKHFSEEHRRKMSKALKGKPSGMLGKCHSEATKKKMSRSAIKKCKENMTYWYNLHKSLQLKPNKPEMALDKMLQKLLPNEYKYVGDLSFILGGKSPDFMNINGKKKLIELYGDYWHKDDDPQDRIDFFRQYGFDTLVIWEKELEDKESLNVKLEKFHY